MLDRRVGKLEEAVLGLIEPAELLVGAAHPVQAVARRQGAVGGGGERAGAHRRQLAQAAQRVLGLPCCEQQRHQLQRRRLALGAVVGDLHQDLGGLGPVAGGDQLGGGGHSLPALEVLLRRRGVVPRPGVGGRGELGLADRGVAAGRVTRPAGAQVRLGGAVVLLGGLPAGAGLGPVAAALVGLARLAGHAQRGEEVARLDGVAAAQVDLRRQLAIDVGSAVQQAHRGLGVSHLQGRLDGLAVLAALLERAHGLRGRPHLAQQRRRLGLLAELAQHLDAAQPDARQLLLDGRREPVDAAAVVLVQALGLDLEHAQRIVEQLGVLVLDGGVVEGAAALEETCGAGGLTERQRRRRGSPVGARQLEEADRLVVMAMGLEQLGRLQGTQGSRLRGGLLGLGVGGELRPAGGAEHRQERAFDRQTLVAGRDRQLRRLAVVAYLGKQLSGLLIAAFARVQLGPLPRIASELGRETGLQNHSACDLRHRLPQPALVSPPLGAV